jgi:hypothetical protein
MARAYAVAGDTKARDAWLAKARQELTKIADAEDRQILEQDIETVPV